LPAELIDGSGIALRLRERVAERVAVLHARGVVPGLTVILVGDDPASAVYVKAKEKATLDAGMRGETVRLPATTSEAELLSRIEALNHDNKVHGILVQMPLPKQIDPQKVIAHILPEKDVDGFHPVNVGLISTGDPRGFAPCTPAGVMVLLRESGVETAGRECVIIGRSNIVGKPMAALMLAADATVTICHSRTIDLAWHTKRADILIAAVGRKEIVTGEMVKPGAVVIDVGMNRVADGTTKSGTRLYGDVHFPSVSLVASKITPVPGGVGPMTIAMLLQNTVISAERVAARVAGTRA
jgi:methylenetetrahydrofolate dehydrogenase (NADP+)/methenyltetrahydrofolate cyclohydrolase